MNPLLHWLTSPEWTNVVGALLHSLWQGAIIALALAVLMRRLANPVTRYRCALGTLGLAVMASIVTWAVLNAPQSTVSAETIIPAIESTQASVATTALNPDSTDKVVALGRMSPPPAPKYWIAWLAVVWMLGAFVMLLRAGIKVAGAENLRRSCQPLNDDRMIALVAEARRAVGLVRQIRVAVTDKLTSPAVVGVIVPTLILPLSLFTALTPEQIRFILLHELAHIRRGDYFANLFQLLAEALLFFNPAVWWISHQIRREREASCDALAIELSGAPADYARTLVRVAENILQPATNSALAFGDGQREPSSLADRVQRLLVPGYRPALRLTWRAMLASLIVGGALLVFSAMGTRSTVGAILSLGESKPATTNDTHVGVKPASVSESKIKSYQEHKIVSSAQSVSSLAQTNIAPLNDNRRVIIRKLNTIKLDQVPFDQQPLREVIRVLSADTLAHDPWGQGINFTLNGVSAPVAPAFDWEASFVAEDKYPVLVTIKPEIRGATLETILDTIVQGADKPIKYSILGDAVAFTLKNESDREPLAMRTFPVDLNAFYAAVRKSAGLPETTTGTNLTAAIRPFFAKAVGVHFDQDSGSTYFLSTSRGQMMIYATLPELDAIEALLQPLTGPPVVTRFFRLAPDFLAKATNELTQAISSVFTTNPAAGFQALLGAIDSNDPPPKRLMYEQEGRLVVARATDADLDKLESTIKPLVDRSSSVPFLTVPASSSAVDLLTRTFMVGPVELARALGRVGPVQVTNAAAMVKELVVEAGVDLQPPKTVVFKDTLGLLMVRATKTELDMIEKFLVQTNQRAASATPPPGSTGEARTMFPVAKTNLAASVRDNSTNLHQRLYAVDANAMAQVLARHWGTNAGSSAKPITDGSLLRPDIQKLFASVGVDLQPPKTLFFNAPKGQLLVRATLEDLDTIESVLQVLNDQSPQVNIRAMFVEVPGDGNGDTFLGNLISPPPQLNRNASGKKGAISASAFTGSNVFTGILTESQFKAVHTALEERKDVKILSRQDVTTLSGRQAQMQTVEMRSIVTGLSTNLPQVKTELMPFGPVLDVIPYVSSDGHTIAMTVIPTVTEFLGYDEPQKNITDYAKSKNMPAELPLPRFRLRQVTTSANVWDGQTLVLGGFVAQEIIRKPDGSEVRERSNKVEKKSLLVFVTATIIDPAGNRVFPDGESPPSSSLNSK